MQKPFIDLVDKILEITNPPKSPLSPLFQRGVSYSSPFIKGGQEGGLFN